MRECHGLAAEKDAEDYEKEERSLNRGSAPSPGV